MFTVELTSYGQSIVSSQVTIDGIILLYDYISDISSVSSIASYSLLLDTEACGNITKHIGCVKICDHSAAQYQAKTILFYKKDGNSKSIIAGYSQNSQLLQKSSGPLSLFISFDFSAFTNGFLFASVQSGYNNAMQNLDGIIHIDDPNISSDDAYSVYSKTQIDNAGFLTSADMSNYVTTNTAQTISGEKTFSASDVHLSSDTALSFIYSDNTAASIVTSSRSEMATSGDNVEVPDVNIDLGTYTNYTRISDDDNAYHKLHIGYTDSEIAYFGDSGLRMASGKNVYANSFIKSGGTSSQFLKADGSVDNTVYATSSSIPTNYVTLNTTQTITGYKDFSRPTTFSDSIVIPYQLDESDYTNYLDGASIYTELGNEFDMISTSGFDFGTGHTSNLVIDLGSDIDIDDTVTDEHGNHIMRPDYEHNKLIIRSLTKDIAYFDYYGLHFREYGQTGGTCIYGTYDLLHDPSDGPQAPSHYLRYDRIHSTWEVDDYITATKFIKTGGTSSQFLKADGSVDSNSYVTSSSLSSNYVTISTTQTVTGSKTFKDISLLPTNGDSDSTIVLDKYHYDNNGTDSTNNEAVLRPTVDQYADLGEYSHRFDNIWAYNIHAYEFDGNASSASTLNSSRYIDGVEFNGSSNITHYGTCSTEANQPAKVVTISNYNVTNPPQTGSKVVVKFTYNNTASNPTLRVSNNGTNGTAAYILYRSNSSNKVSGSSNYHRWQANDIVEFVFDGTYWVWIGFREHTSYANNASSSDYSYQLNDPSDNEIIIGDDYNNDTVFYSSTDFLPLNDSSSDLGKSDYRWNSVYTGAVNFGIANSDASTTYTASLQLYNSDTTNYKNGISCAGNFLPISTNTYNLGSPSLKWGTTYTEIISMGLDNECTISHVSNNTRYEHIVITVTPENKNGSLHIDTSSYSERTGAWSTFEFSFSGNSFYSLDHGDLGISLCPWSCVYTDKLYFGVVPSSETNTIACTFTKYSNDTTNYKNGLQCSCNFLPYYNNLYCLGSTTLKWDTVYANQIGDSNNAVTVYGTATESEQLKKTVSSTDYTFSLNSSNYWVSNTNILPSVNSTSTSTGKDLGSSSYKWRYLYAYQLGTSSYKITNSYITNLYFGTANSNSSSAYTAALKLYNSDTTNYYNGVQCTGNLLPSSSDTYSLGSSSSTWKNIFGTIGSSSSRQNVWAGSIYFGNSTSATPRMNAYNSGLDVYGNITPGSNDMYTLGSSSYAWKELYTNNINIYFLAISVQVPTSAPGSFTVNRGDTVSMSSTGNSIKYISDASLHIYQSTPYANGSYNTPSTISGTYKLLGSFSCTNDNAYRTFIVPAIKVI